jgi:hypothetical protein
MKEELLHHKENASIVTHKLNHGASVVDHTLPSVEAKAN